METGPAAFSTNCSKYEINILHHACQAKAGIASRENTEKLSESEIYRESNLDFVFDIFSLNVNALQSSQDGNLANNIKINQTERDIMIFI